MLEAVKTVPLKDNTGHYGILYGSGVCLNDQVKEHGFAYTRPAMNATKSDDNAAPGMLPVNRVTGRSKDCYHLDFKVYCFVDV